MSRLIKTLHRFWLLTITRRKHREVDNRTVGDLFSQQGKTKFDRIDHIAVMRAETEND